MAATSVEIVTGPSSLGVVDGQTNFSALKTTLRPLEYGALGHYSITGLSGLMTNGAASNKQIFYAQNTGTNLVLLQELKITGMATSTAAFAAGFIQLDAYIARSFTGENASPLGTALTITTNNAKERTSMGTTSLAVVRISTTAPLGDPTWTLDAQPFGRILTHSSAGYQTATPIIGSIFLPDDHLFKVEGAEHPVVLAANEGVAILQTVPATGKWTFGVHMKWAEVAAY